MTEAAAAGMPETITMNLYTVELQFWYRDEDGSVAWRGNLNDETTISAKACKNDVFLMVETRTGLGLCRVDFHAPTLIEAERMLPEAIVDAMNAATILRNALPARKDSVSDAAE